jgi:hypothetical protein
MGGPGFVRWETEFPDARGVQYPGPGTFGTDTSDYCVVRGTPVVEGPAAVDDDTFGPVERWLFNASLVGEEGVEDLEVDLGTIQYTSGPLPSTQAADFPDNTDRLISVSTPTDAALRIPGELTVAVWVWPGTVVGSLSVSRIIDCGLTGTTGTANSFLYNLVFSTNPGRIRFNWQDSAQVLQQNTTTPEVSTEEWHHIVAVRSSGGAGDVTSRIYADGVLFNEVTGLNPAFGGENVPIHVGQGDNDAGGLRGRVSAIKVFDQALTQAEVMALYKRGIQPELR